ncbi:MAG: hypothetical protein E6R03_00850 [Hyphomicrobiaceae bacterium]|nr:MAG: hypothetical protein E6R03_00850 [Hyphomicrobiaceae bacterium]
MNTTANAGKEVFVIMDGVESGPFTVESFAQNVRNGIHGADCIWRFADDAEYKSIDEIPTVSPSTAPPPPLPNTTPMRLRLQMARKSSNYGFLRLMVLLVLCIEVVGVVVCGVALIMAAAIKMDPAMVVLAVGGMFVAVCINVLVFAALRSLFDIADLLASQSK